MYRKWRKLSVLGMAALIGCLMPMGTMMAAEENTEAVWENGAGSVSDNTVSDDDKTGADKEINDSEEVNADDEVNNGEEVNADDEADNDDEINEDHKVNSDIAAMPVTVEEAAANDAAATAGEAAPVIEIKWQGQNRTYNLGGKIEYEYVNNYYQSINCSATQSGQAVSLFYCQDKITDTTAEAKENEQMDALSWTAADSTSMNITFISDGNYALYVKAVGADGQTVYARSGGIIVDTAAPKVIGVQEGNTYPEGTVFQVQDSNLESVTVNEKPVALSADGKYQVVANGTSCVIKAKDKAGNSIACSITVSGKDPSQDGNVISKSGIYSLKAGVAYHLAEGRWSVSGDRTVYRGDGDFYVKTAGDYRLIKY
ncbi:MAG: hypothetical protein K2L82_03385 [Lachnospiraceae bacterium]|nr:hypothetical protein [Lachnospiraceae bacterium]